MDTKKSHFTPYREKVRSGSSDKRKKEGKERPFRQYGGQLFVSEWRQVLASGGSAQRRKRREAVRIVRKSVQKLNCSDQWQREE